MKASHVYHTNFREDIFRRSFRQIIHCDVEGRGIFNLKIRSPYLTQQPPCRVDELPSSSLCLCPVWPRVFWGSPWTGFSSPCFTGLEVDSSALLSTGLPWGKQQLCQKTVPAEGTQVILPVRKARAENTGLAHFLRIFSEASAYPGFKFAAQENGFHPKGGSLSSPALKFHYKFRARKPRSVEAL